MRDVKSVSNQIEVRTDVSDEQIIFSGTLAQNLLFANPLADAGRIERAIIERHPAAGARILAPILAFRDVIPLVRVNPQYPTRAAARGIEYTP